MSVLIGCPVVCAGCFGPAIDCPESLAVGEEGVVSAVQVDDAIDWDMLRVDGGQAAFVLPDGAQASNATTSVLGDPGFLSGRTEITVHALSAGTVTIRAVETTIGPGIGMPRLLGSETCTIEIVAESD